MDPVIETLYRELETQLSHALQALRDAKLVVGGTGALWHCAVERRSRICRVEFDGREFVAAFEWREPADVQVGLNAHVEAEPSGHTSNVPALVEAVSAWLRESSIQEMHDRFDFVDREKRRLVALMNVVCDHVPALARSEHCALRNSYYHGRWYEMWLGWEDRSCLVWEDEDDLHLHSAFLWDDCEQFDWAVADDRVFATLVRSWLCDAARSSDIARQFSGVTLHEIAGYYESGRPVEGEFILSWKDMSEFYEEGKKPEAVALVHAPRARV